MVAVIQDGMIVNWNRRLDTIEKRYAIKNGCKSYDHK